MGVRTENGAHSGLRCQPQAGNILLLLSLVVLLAGCGSRSTADLLNQLHAKESAQRLHAVNELARRAGEAEVVVPALAEALKDEDSFVRRDAARALGELGPAAKPALPGLVLALRDQHAAVRKAATEALRKIDTEAAARAGVR
jgi:HEAT repeat protein